jgi:hypothetical protein
MISKHLDQLITWIYAQVEIIFLDYYKIIYLNR